jgi:type I restriction enzyme R subunit
MVDRSPHIGWCTAHTTMSKQALESEQVRDGLKNVLLGPARLYEALREKAVEQAAKK